MGLCSRYKSLTCNSCSMHCQIMPEESPRLQYCANSCFCMWPEESSYFNRGVVEGILTKNHNARLSGYIFVDFSVSFLRLFLEKDWIDYLALMNPLMILVKIIKLRWIHILSYDQMVSRKINNQTTRCANSIFYTTLFTNSAPNYT